jgi:hypothetical protein
MALSIPSVAEVFQESQIMHLLFSATAIEQERDEFKKKERLGLETIIDSGSWFSPASGQLQLKDYSNKIESSGFLFNTPWLPPNAHKLLNKLKKGPITEGELVRLMELVAERAFEHFRLDKGKFVAMTLYGRVVEVSNTRTDLLKKIQSRKYKEQIFVWRVGFDSFSGRI